MIYFHECADIGFDASNGENDAQLLRHSTRNVQLLLLLSTSNRVVDVDILYVDTSRLELRTREPSSLLFRVVMFK